MRFFTESASRPVQFKICDVCVHVCLMSPSLFLCGHLLLVVGGEVTIGVESQLARMPAKER